MAVVRVRHMIPSVFCIGWWWSLGAVVFLRLDHSFLDMLVFSKTAHSFLDMLVFFSKAAWFLDAHSEYKAYEHAFGTGSTLERASCARGRMVPYPSLV